MEQKQDVITIRAGIRDNFNINTFIAANSQNEAETYLKQFIFRFLAILNQGDLKHQWIVKNNMCFKSSTGLYGAFFSLNRSVV